MLKKLKKKNKGFTLVELLVVIAIIGILAVVAAPSLFKNINKAKAAEIVSDYSAIKAAITSAYADGDLVNGTYSNTPNQGIIAHTNGSKLDIQDLSGETKYSIVVDTSKSTAKLTITTKDEEIAERVADSISGTQDATNPEIVTVDILKQIK